MIRCRRGRRREVFLGSESNDKKKDLLQLDSLSTGEFRLNPFFYLQLETLIVAVGTRGGLKTSNSNWINLSRLSI